MYIIVIEIDILDFFSSILNRNNISTEIIIQYDDFFRLMANKPDTATAGVFINSLSSSAEYKVYTNNMDNESFIGHPDYLDYVLKNSKSGFFALDSQVDDADICKV